MKFLFPSLRASSLPMALVPILVLGCGSAEETPAASEGQGGQEVAATETPAAEPIRELDVVAAAALFQEGEAHPVDANSDQTRTSVGCVPGATLLSSSSQYEMDELPSDGLLVFYCGSTQCTASDNAATRAREAGREVAVMRPGIRGWVDAGKPTTRPEDGAESAPALDSEPTEAAEGTPS